MRHSGGVLKPSAFQFAGHAAMEVGIANHILELEELVNA